MKKAAVSEMFSCLISSSDGKFPLMPFRIDHHRLLFWIFIEGYLHYKTIVCHKVVLYV